MNFGDLQIGDKFKRVHTTPLQYPVTWEKMEQRSKCGSNARDVFDVFFTARFDDSIPVEKV